jgi:hypothetical protein
MKKYKHDRNILVDGKKDQRLVKVTLWEINYLT